MKLGYYPGCSLTGTAKEFDASLRALLATLGVEMQELADWSCCGASSAHALNHLLALALPLHNLSLAQAQGCGEVLAPCAACFSRLAGAQAAVQHDEALRGRVEYVLEHPLPGRVGVLNLLDILTRIGTEAIRAKVTLPMDGLKIACYYGCLLVRPPEVAHCDDTEHPQVMEQLVSATGATAIDWNFKTECCGAAHAIARTDIVVDLSRKLLDDAQARGADVVVVACPMCHANLDMRQRAMHKTGHTDIPILYLTELLGLAMGVDARALGLHQHMTATAPLLAKLRTEVPA
jgi:heterodisulfide reductase subunit B2